MRPLPLAATLAVLPLTVPAQTRHPITRTTAASATHEPGVPGGRSSSAGVPATLPVTHVSLYKNGVGFIEHTGHVAGDAAVTIDFTSGQLNDVLQSLTAIDLNGGRISGAGYNSTTPLDQQLKTLPLSLDQNPTAADFYSALRGARVEVHSPTASITGRLLSVEARALPAKSSDDSSAQPERYFLTVVADSGDTRTLELTPATSVRLLDSSLHADVSRYLQLLDANRSQGLRHLTLLDMAPARGTGSRQLRVSYISEVPVWKSTYRILFSNPTNPAAPSVAPSATGGTSATLQGWSVVDNTTGTDWNNIQLSLIAGAPQSFIQPLSQPIYSRRPEIPIAQEAQLTPQTFDSAIDNKSISGPAITGTLTDASGAAIPNAQITVTDTSSGAQYNASSSQTGSFAIPVSAPGQYRLEASSPGFQRTIQTVSVLGQNASNVHLTLNVGAVSESVEVAAALIGGPVSMAPAKIGGGRMGGSGGAIGGIMQGRSYAQLAQASLNPAATTAGFDDFFAYNLTQPITIRKNESALVPILQTKLSADPVTLISSNGYSTGQPLRALWITNTSGLTLDRGSFTIVEDGAFGGEGLLDPIHPDEKRLLSYAADQAVHVATEDAHGGSRVTSISASKGVLTLHTANTRELTYVVHNSAAAPRTIVLEHPVEPGFKLDDGIHPTETTATVHRFRLQAAPGATVRLHLSGRRDLASVYRLTDSLTDSNAQQLTVILNQTDRNPALVQALQPVFDARRRLADAQSAVDQTKARLDALRSDEERQRANITALKDADKTAGKSVAARFVNDLTHTEDAITAAQTELTTRTAALDAARTDLSNRIETLQLDQTL